MTQLRSLGRSGLLVSPLAFGGNVFGWTVDETASFRLLDAWVDAGFNLVDTADVYSRWVPGHSGGESETIIGKWLRQSGKRSRVVLATKVGKPMGDDKSGLSPAYIREAVEASLQRLQTDHIDLYQSHDDDAATPLEDTLGAFNDLIKAGILPEQLKNIHALGYTEVQGFLISKPMSREAVRQLLHRAYDTMPVPPLQEEPRAATHGGRHGV